MMLCTCSVIVYVYTCRLVIDVLKGVEGERKCFRMVGGVLVERTVKDVLPALEYNNEQVLNLASLADLPHTCRKSVEITDVVCRC